jgi:Immunity protein 8
MAPARGPSVTELIIRDRVGKRLSNASKQSTRVVRYAGPGCGPSFREGRAQRDDIGVRPVVNLLKPMWPKGPNAEPADPTHFGVRILLWIGSDQGASDSFNCLACSPSWLAEQFPDGDQSQLAGVSHVDLASSASVDLMVGTGLVLMRKWSVDALRQAVERICDRCAGPDWDETASRLGRYFPWEFDYLRDQYVDEHPEKFHIPPYGDRQSPGM